MSKQQEGRHHPAINGAMARNVVGALVLALHHNDETFGVSFAGELVGVMVASAAGEKTGQWRAALLHAAREQLQFSDSGDNGEECTAGLRGLVKLLTEG